MLRSRQILPTKKDDNNDSRKLIRWIGPPYRKCRAARMAYLVGFVGMMIFVYMTWPISMASTANSKAAIVASDKLHENAKRDSDAIVTVSATPHSRGERDITDGAPVTSRVKPPKAHVTIQRSQPEPVSMAQSSEADQKLNAQHAANEAKLTTLQAQAVAPGVLDGSNGLRNGNLVYLKSKSTGKYIDVEGDNVQARWQERRDSQQLVIRSAHGVISSGVEIFLKAHTGKIIAFPPSHEEDARGSAKWHDYGPWQILTVHKDGGGVIHSGDTVYLAAYNGMRLRVSSQSAELLASLQVTSPQQEFIIEGLGGDTALVPTFSDSKMKDVSECHCPSGASGRFVPIIMDKQAVDVCPLVCASSWARTFEAEPVSTFLSDEPAIIQAGLRAMTARNLAVCITMRNREDLVPGIRHSIEQKLARLFNSTHVIIIENDSRKGLQKALASWKHSVEHRMGSTKQYQGGEVVDVHVNSYRFNAPSSIPGDIGGVRFHLLGVLRNECLLEVQDSGADILINMDVDHDLQHGWEMFDTNGLAHSFGLKEQKETAWDVACANGMTHATPKVEPQTYHQFMTYGTEMKALLTYPMYGLFVVEGDSFNSDLPLGVKFNVCEQSPCAPISGHSCLALPPHNLEDFGHAMWRATKDCQADGARDPSNDENCDIKIGPQQSGFCECSKENTVGFDCFKSRPLFTCRDMCKYYRTLGSSVTVETCSPAIFVALGPCGLQESKDGHSTGIQIHYDLSYVPPGLSDPKASCDQYAHKLSGDAVKLDTNLFGKNKDATLYVTSCINAATVSVQTHSITLDPTHCARSNTHGSSDLLIASQNRFQKTNGILSQYKGAMLALMKRMQGMSAFWGIAYNVCHTADCEPKSKDSCEVPQLGKAMQCVKWHATTNCNPDGPLMQDEEDPNLDPNDPSSAWMVMGLTSRNCMSEIRGGQSGFCECEEGRTVKFGCSDMRAPFTCAQACSNRLIFGSDFAVHMKYNPSVFVALGPCGGDHRSATKYQLFYKLTSSAPASNEDWMQSSSDAGKFSCSNFPNRYEGPIQLEAKVNRRVFITSCVEVDAPESYHSSRATIVQTHSIALVHPVPTLPEFVTQWNIYDSLAFRDEHFNRNNWASHQVFAHLPHDKPVFAKSCFGGLAVHDLKGPDDWRRCSYAAHADNDCEHVSFYKCLREKLGWKVMMNPRMWLKYTVNGM